MEATTLTAPTPTYHDRWQMLGGDRFYTAARWVVLLLLIATSGLVAHQPIWPPSLAMPLFLLLIWAYALFNLVTTVALVVPQIGWVLNIAFLVDIIF
ncbi:MAG TPA: histidine kinase, partial [Roseiflexaceae bacterium]